jgi:hypothetical protein
MKKIRRSLFASAVLSTALLGGCGDAAAPTEAAQPVAGQAARLNLAGEVARSMAPMLARAELRQQVRALIQDSAKGKISYEKLLTMGQALPAGAEIGQARLEVSAPLGWSSDAAPVVTFVPELPEAEVRELTYFDASGRMFTRPADERPAEPVLVVGPSEEQPSDAGSDAGSIVPLATKRLVVGRVLIRNDHEPWYRGDPEIYARCTFPAAGVAPIILDLPEVNRENAWYTINRVLGYYSDSYGTPARCGLFESDGPFDGSDSLGTVQVWFASPYGTFYITDGVFTLQP